MNREADKRAFQDEQYHRECAERARDRLVTLSAMSRRKAAKEAKRTYQRAVQERDGALRRHHNAISDISTLIDGVYRWNPDTKRANEIKAAVYKLFVEAKQNVVESVPILDEARLLSGDDWLQQHIDTTQALLMEHETALAAIGAESFNQENPSHEPDNTD